MKIKDFKLMVEAGAVDSVILFRLGSAHPWTIRAEGSRIPLRLRGWIETAKEEVRQFADLNTAYGVIRSAGWSDSITIQG
jgi:hypothetical protein